MRTYTIYVRTFQGIRSIDSKNKLDKIYDTGWSVYATVVGAKELVNTLLNSKYKKLHAKEWCKKYWVALALSGTFSPTLGTGMHFGASQLSSPLFLHL